MSKKKSFSRVHDVIMSTTSDFNISDILKSDELTDISQNTIKVYFSQIVNSSDKIVKTTPVDNNGKRGRKRWNYTVVDKKIEEVVVEPKKVVQKTTTKVKATKPMPSVDDSIPVVGIDTLTREEEYAIARDILNTEVELLDDFDFNY